MYGREPHPVSAQLQEVELRLHQAGLDLTQWCALDVLQSNLPKDLPLPPSDAPASLGLMVANTRRFWSNFITNLEASVAEPEEAVAGESHPLDAYVEESITSSLSATHIDFNIYYAHTSTAAPFPIQRYAQAMGLAHLGPAHLCIHPVVGPWLGLRALITFDAPLNELEGIRLATRPAPNSCASCHAPCLIALDRARRSAEDKRSAPLAHQLNKENFPQISSTMAPWLKVRDTCPVGKNYRYNEAQILYHYDKDPRALTTSSPSKIEKA